jgi:hypothetical protein
MIHAEGTDHAYSELEQLVDHLVTLGRSLTLTTSPTRGQFLPATHCAPGLLRLSQYLKGAGWLLYDFKIDPADCGVMFFIGE